MVYVIIMAVVLMCSVIGCNRNLADTKNRGALDAADFTIAMYLIQASMSGQLRTLPLTLPPGLYEQAGGRSPFDAVVSHATGGSGSFSPSMSGSFSGRPMSTLEPQFTGASSVFHPQMTGQLRSAPSAPPLPARSVLANPSSTFPFAQPQTTQQWDVTPSEKANADRIFDELDKQKRGFIEGDVAVPFMLKSQLPEDVLAQVWYAYIRHSTTMNGLELNLDISLGICPT